MFSSIQKTPLQHKAKALLKHTPHGSWPKSSLLSLSPSLPRLHCCSNHPGLWSMSGQRSSWGCLFRARQPPPICRLRKLKEWENGRFTDDALRQGHHKRRMSRFRYDHVYERVLTIGIVGACGFRVPGGQRRVRGLARDCVRRDHPGTKINQRAHTAATDEHAINCTS